MQKVHERETSKDTMTVSELIAELQKYNPNIPVIAEWEGVWSGFRPNNFRAKNEDGRTILLIDVEDYG